MTLSYAVTHIIEVDTDDPDTGMSTAYDIARNAPRLDAPTTKVTSISITLLDPEDEV